MDGGTLVRDSKWVGGAELAVRRGAWVSFIGAVKRGTTG
ncbi:DUF397 domain-containing protein [Streptomyces sp. NY05-11A]